MLRQIELKFGIIQIKFIIQFVTQIKSLHHQIRRLSIRIRVCVWGSVNVAAVKLEQLPFSNAFKRMVILHLSYGFRSNVTSSISEVA